MACKACVEKDRHIETLKEQIEWMKTHAGTPTLRHSSQAWEETEPLHETEEESDIRSMIESRALNDNEAREALERVMANVQID